MGRRDGIFLKNRKGKKLLYSLFFFAAGTIYVCWQEADTDSLTYGKVQKYIEEHKEEFPELQEKEEPLEEEIREEQESTEEGKEFAGQPAVEGFLVGDIFNEKEAKMEKETPEGYVVQKSGTRENRTKIKTLYQSGSLEYLLQNFYIVNPTTTIDKKVFCVEEMLHKDCTIKKEKKKPQILIFHTHGASEHFSDSRAGKEDSVIGVGKRLQEILEETYGYNVMHDETPYDLIDGEIDRNQAYTVAENALAKTLEKYPSIEVMIDLHRDASSDGKTKRVTEINGKKVAQVMFFNGLSRNLSGDIEYLYNPNLKGNLAFSLQMKIKAMEYFEDFALPIFLKGYRYSLHLREKSLLIELGNEVNTVEEAKNAMEPLACILDAVLSGK